jgi:hypothetical protein
MLQRIAARLANDTERIAEKFTAACGCVKIKIDAIAAKA